MPIQKYFATEEKDKDSVRVESCRIRSLLRSELNLIVDITKQGSGNSNTGNTAGRAFENSEFFF